MANWDGTDFRVSCDVPLSFVSCAVWEPNQQLTFWLCTFKNTYKVLVKFSPVVCYNNYIFVSQSRLQWKLKTELSTLKAWPLDPSQDPSQDPSPSYLRRLLILQKNQQFLDICPRSQVRRRDLNLESGVVLHGRITSLNIQVRELQYTFYRVNFMYNSP